MVQYDRSSWWLWLRRVGWATPAAGVHAQEFEDQQGTSVPGTESANRIRVGRSLEREGWENTGPGRSL